jgi:hypothetical protein
MPMASKKSVATVPPKRNTNVATLAPNDPFADAGLGSEKVSATDLIIPRLTLLHEMSRVTKKNRAEFIKGAAGGMFCIPSLHKLYDGEEGIYVVPVYYQRRLIEWHPIDSGGGLVRMDVPEEETEHLERKNAGVWLTDNDTEIVQTPEFYLLIADLETGEMTSAVMSLTGKKAQTAKRWNTLIMAQRQVHPETGQEVQMPFWFNTYHMIARPESNDQGDFYVPSVSVHEQTLEISEFGPRIYARAREFYKAVTGGIAKAADITAEDR